MGGAFVPFARFAAFGECMVPAFTDKYIRGLKPKDKRFVVREGVGDVSRGFCLRVAPSGAKTWYYTYKEAGAARWVNLGQFPVVSLAEARERYRERREARERGVDPLLLVQPGEANGSLRDLKEQYIQSLRDNGKGSARQFELAIDNQVFDSISPDKLARDVTAGDVKLVMHSRIKAGAGTFSNRLRQIMHAMFKFGIEYDNDPRFIDRPLLFGIPFNPAANVPMDRRAERVGERTLSAKELRFHWDNFSGMYAFLHKLMVLLGGQRPIDVLTTRWRDFDLKERVLDPSRASKKNERVNVLPLSDAVVAQLKGLHTLTGDSEFLFPRGAGGRAAGQDSAQHMTLSGNSRAVCKFVQAHGLVSYSTRDLRRTVKTLMGKAGVPKSVRDRLQNHNVSDVSSKHYDRYDYLNEKREALATWEGYLVDRVKVVL